MTGPVLARAARALGVVLLASLCCTAKADAGNPFELVEKQPLNELWLTPGFYSFHFQSDKHLNNNNIGFGAEYRYSTVSALTAGRFNNSVRVHSNYAGLLYQPLALGPVRLGAVLAAFNGYPNMRDGGWFPALVPAASFEYGRVGINAVIVPTYKDRIYGSLSIQLKLKLFD
ncbi:MAG: hypothetical protein V4724_41095 [Pseudomonadota bacterium]